MDCLEGIACRGGADGKINHQEAAYKRQRKVVETGVGKKESTVQKRTTEEKEKVKVETTKTISTVPVIVDSGKNKRGGSGKGSSSRELCQYGNAQAIKYHARLHQHQPERGDFVMGQAATTCFRDTVRVNSVEPTRAWWRAVAYGCVGADQKI